MTLAAILGEIVLEAVKAYQAGTPGEAILAAAKEAIERAKVAASDAAFREELGVDEGRREK